MKINYFVLGTNDKARAIAFYDALFADHSIKQLHNEGRMTLWAGEGFMFAIAEPSMATLPRWAMAACHDGSVFITQEFYSDGCKTK